MQLSEQISSPPIDSEVQAEQFARADIWTDWPRLALAMFCHKNTRGEPMSFDRRPWQIGILKDNADDLTVMKCVQVGVTDIMICDLMVNAMTGRPVMYVLPRDSDVNSFTPRRIGKLIQRSEFYKENCRAGRRESDTKKQKTLFGVDCFFVGSQAEENFHEKPIDTLIFDEMDKCNQNNLHVAYDRLAASDHPRVRKIGNPTIAARSIAKAFDATDQRWWFIQCDHCNERQRLSWFKNVVRQESEREWFLRSPDGVPNNDSQDVDILCAKCERPINRLAPGEWVPEIAGIKSHGYQCSRLFADARHLPVIRMLWDLWLDSQSSLFRIQEFHNKALGLPFKHDGACLTLDVLSGCAEPGYSFPMTAEATTGGIDVGSVLHIVISQPNDDGRNRIVYVGTCPVDLEEAAFILNQYGCDQGVIDGLPEQKFAKDLCAEFPGFYRCYYQRTEDRNMQLNVNHEEQKVVVDKTESLDKSFFQWVKKLNIISDSVPEICGGDFLDQMTAPVRVLNEDSNPPRYVWDEGSSADHFRHADNYRCVGIEISGGGGQQIWGA